MAKFTTRVELHKATGQDYEALHTEMENRGFTRTIKYENDVNVYQLPSAEYNLDSAVEINDVRDMAQAAAAATGKNCSIIVTKADGPRYVYNLPVLRQRVL